MDWSPTVASLIGTAVGGMIAALAGWAQARAQRAAALEDFNRQMAAEREREVRARADDKAIELLAMFVELSTSLGHHPPALGSGLWQGEDRLKGQDVLRRIRENGHFLQEPLRTHVMVVPNVFSRMDETLYKYWKPGTAHFIAREMVKDAETALGQYLRGEPVSTEAAGGTVAHRAALQAMVNT